MGKSSVHMDEGDMGVHEAIRRLWAVLYWLSEMTYNGQCRQDLLLGTTRQALGTRERNKSLLQLYCQVRGTVHVLVIMFHEPLT